MVLPCPDCSFAIPASAVRCPHCARPGYFPNVRAADQEDERTALAVRVEAATTECGDRKALGPLGAFVDALKH